MAEAVVVPPAEAQTRPAEASLGSQSVAMSVGLLASRGLGFVRDVVIAYRFGASAQTDAYLVAIQIPTVAENLLAGPALHNALIPVAAQETAAAPSGARLRQLLWNAGTLTLAVNGAAVLVLAASATWLVPLFAGGFSLEARALAVQLTMLALLGMPLMALTRLAWAILNVQGRFWGPALSQSLSNVALILFALFLGVRLGIHALAAGFVIGLGLQVLVQYIELGRLGLLGIGAVNWRDPDLLSALRQFLPLALGQLVVVLSPAVDTAIATFLPPGGVTIIRYAQGVIVPFAIISVAVSAPAMPRLSRLVSQDAFEAVTGLLQRVVRPLSLMLFGAAACVFVARTPLVTLLYQRGAFDALAVRQTADTLGVYAFSIPFAGLYYFLLRGLVAFAAGRAILLLNLVALVLNVALDLLFLPLFAHAGIALSSLCVQVVYMLIAALVLSRKLRDQHFLPGIWRPLLANAAAAAVAILAGAAASGPVARLASGELPLLVVPALVAGAVYLALSRVLGAGDLAWLISLLPAGVRSFIVGARGRRAE
ncbi:MAG: murein biosynthesis integral membrane protein MurJ [Anaerolineales bacterium]|nr:murein biosynthesis integral membrane protein MurJ [Anaerolineales bacterium]